MDHRVVKKVMILPILLVLLSITSCVTSQGSTSQGRVLRPVVSEQVSPVVAITPVASDAFVGEAFLRKPPGDGPFPAVVLIHGGAPRWPTAQLREFTLHTHASRFLAAGYVVVAMTRRDLDLSLPPTQEQNSVLDGVAVIDYVKGLPYVDPLSVVVRGTSVGGYLALELAAARELAAVMVEEPFSMPFVGLSPGADGNAVAQTEKIALLNRPILLLRGDQTANINSFNREVFIPALRAAGKQLTVLTYPGELHSFAFYNSAERTLRPGVALEAFAEIDNFFREYIQTQPVPLNPTLLTHERIERE